MAAFVPSVQVSASLDGKTITLTDNSPYTVNDSGVTILNTTARVVAITDGKGNVLSTQTFASGVTTQSFTVTKDYMFIMALTWTAGGVNYPNNQTALSTRIFDFTQYTKQGNSCNSCKIYNNCNGNPSVALYERDAAFFYKDFLGSEPVAQDRIDDANTLINSTYA